MPLPTYLDLDGFRTRTLLNVTDVDFVETDSPGFVLSRIKIAISHIHGRLRKRYGKTLPFSAPYPEIILDWITRIVSYEVMRKRGANPSDSALEGYKSDAERALAEVKEAADSKDGIFDLPNPEEGESNISTAGPLGYSEQSAYVWSSIERAAGVEQDRNGEGD
jgi:hypothetical protein